MHTKKTNSYKLKNKQIIQAVLGRLYRYDSIYLKGYRIEKNVIIGRFLLPNAPLYLKEHTISTKERHFAASELVLCCNQLIYILLMHMFIGMMENVPQISLESYLKKMPRVLATKFIMTFHKEIDPSDFEASIVSEKIFYRREVYYIKTKIEFDGGKQRCTVNVIMPD